MQIVNSSLITQFSAPSRPLVPPSSQNVHSPQTQFVTIIIMLLSNIPFATFKHTFLMAGHPRFFMASKICYRQFSHTLSQNPKPSTIMTLWFNKTGNVRITNIEARGLLLCRGKPINITYLCVCVCVRARARVPERVGVCMRVHACSPACPACNAYAPYCDVICGPSGFTIFFEIIS